MDENTHVYCTLCCHGKKLIEELIKHTPLKEPEDCNGCCSYNPEDSMRFKDRPNYKPLNE